MLTAMRHYLFLRLGETLQVTMSTTRQSSHSSLTNIQKTSDSERDKEGDQGECCRIVFISDTHSVHQRLGNLPSGDVLIHGGDFTKSRPAKAEEYKDFSDWLGGQPHPHKILISGNRDQLMDSSAKVRSPTPDSRTDMTVSIRQHEPSEMFWLQQMQDYVKGNKSVVYLEDDQHLIDISPEFRIKVYGSPWTATHGKPGKSFQVGRSELREKWEKIPRDVDILVTHMPPYGVRDENAGKVKAGCRDLLRLLSDSLEPRIHVFGHIHESHGWSWGAKTLFINASIKASGSHVNSPIVVDYYKNSRKLEIIQ